MSDASRPAETSLFERLRGLLGLNPGSVRDDIEEALEDSSGGADFSPKERAILKNVLALHDVRVADVMAPRADVIALPLDASVAEALSTFRTAGHSRLPIYHETLDDPRGMIHIRDFLDFLAAHPAFGLVAGDPGAAAAPQKFDMATPLSATPLVRPVLFAPPSMPALDLLARMQASHVHIALVIDEYGGTDGLVSMEDIVETIVGNIEDEHDEAAGEQISRGADGKFTVEARAPLDEVAKAVGFDVTELEQAEDVDTIGGLVAAFAGRVPARGEIVAGPDGFEFEVLDADPRRLKRVRIHPPAPAGSAAPKTPAVSGEMT
ncbi:MAG: HlyC/CorC family transporter [Pseudomonadota bacterium]|nr:HlyC/CorC family transporter [Pseudomonadota bacterium]